MKKNTILSLVGVAAAGLLLASCSNEPENVTVLATPDGNASALVVKYSKVISADGVAADSYVVDGKEIEAVFVTDKDITAIQAKHDCEKSEAKHDCEKSEAKHDCEKSEAKHDCEKSEAKHDCEKSNAKADCKAPKSTAGQYVVIVLKKAACEAKHGDCESEKDECAGEQKKCDKAEAKAEVAPVELSVKQVKEIKAADGSSIAAWSKSVKSSATVACPFKHGKKHHHGATCHKENNGCSKEAEKAN